ncbi:hypothetical protein KR018_000623, partial [Drosophila ironensis]
VPAFACVSQDDIVSLRIVCTMARNKEHNLEELDSYGNTALLKACYLGKFECARTLLEFGANIFAVNYFGQNCLTLATYAGHLGLVQELLCRRSYKDFNRSSLIPALCVAIMENHVPLQRFFQGLDPQAQLNIQTVHGLGVHDLKEMVLQTKRLNRQHQRSPPTFFRYGLR